MGQKREDRKSQIIKALSRYLPSRIVEKIKMNPKKKHIEGERRRATVLFMDISGFTAISENLDPEEVVNTVNGFFNSMHKIIDKYGGEIDKFMGDAMLVLWGTPIAHEDDDERAVRAAMEMMAALDDFNNSRPKEIRENFPISMTIGINSGIVFAGNVGSEKRMEYTVMGDNVNLAARLEGMANPREIMISGETAKSLSEEILLKDIGKVPIKGKKEPVQVYLVAGLKSEIGELVEKHSFYISRSELEEKLYKLLKKENYVSVIGPAGVGKTHFVLNILTNFDYFSINAADQNIPFGFLKSNFSKLLDISLIDNNKSKQLKIQEFIKKNNEFLNDLPTFLDLFGIKSIFKGEERKWKIFELADKLLKTFYKNIIIDKFDYIDELSLMFIKTVMELNNNHKFIFISRKEMIPNLPTIKVQNFDFDMTQKYILEYFGKKYFPDELFNKIYDISKGNPNIINGLLDYLEKNQLLFLEKDEIYLKVPLEKISLPEEYSGLVLSIFDSYDEYTKKFLQYGTLFGEKFRIDELNKLINYKPGRIEGSLRNLIADNIVKREGDIVYFLNENLKDAVYNILLKSKRKELHTKIGFIFENKGYDVFNIANHFLSGNNKEKAIEYGRKAIDEAYENYDNHSVVNLVDRLFPFLDNNDIENIIYLREKKMKALYRLSYYEMAIKEGSIILQLTKKLNEIKKYYDISNVYAAYHMHLNKVDESLKILKDLEIEPKIKKYPEIQKELYVNLGLTYKIIGNNNKAEEYFNLALNLAEKYKLKKENVYINLGQLYFNKNNILKAKNYFEKAEKEANKNKEFYFLTMSLLEIGKCEIYLGETEQARSYFEKALNISKEKKFKYLEGLALNSLATFYKDNGNFEKAKEIYEKAIYISKGLLDYENITRIYHNLGLTFSLNNHLIEAQRYFELSIQYSKKSNNFMLINNYLEMATLFRKMGLSKKYGKFAQETLRILDKKSDIYAFFILHSYISKIELQDNIPVSLLNEIERVKNFPIWNDLSIVYEFFTQLKEKNYKKAREISTIIIKQIGDPSLISFLFPEIADVIRENRELLDILKQIIKDKISQRYIEFLQNKKIKNDDIECFYKNGLYQIVEKLCKFLEKKSKKYKILNENRLFLIL